MTVLYTEINPDSRIFPFRKFRDAVMSLKLVLIAPFLVCFESFIISQKGETFVNKSLALLRTL